MHCDAACWQELLQKEKKMRGDHWGALQRVTAVWTETSAPSLCSRNTDAASVSQSARLIAAGLHQLHTSHTAAGNTGPARLIERTSQKRHVSVNMFSLSSRFIDQHLRLNQCHTGQIGAQHSAPALASQPFASAIRPTRLN